MASPLRPPLPIVEEIDDIDYRKAQAQLAQRQAAAQMPNRPAPLPNAQFSQTINSRPVDPRPTSTLRPFIGPQPEIKVTTPTDRPSMTRPGGAASPLRAPAPAPAPAPAASAPGQPIGKAARVLKSIPGAGNALNAVKSLPGRAAKFVGKTGVAGLGVAGAVGAFNDARKGETPDYIQAMATRGNRSPTVNAALDNNPMLREIVELPATAANVLLNTGRNAVNTVAGMFGSEGIPNSAAASPLRPGAAPPTSLGPSAAPGRGRNPQPAGGQVMVGDAPVGASARGDQNGGFYDSAANDEVIGTFNGRPITKGMSEMIGSKMQVVGGGNGTGMIPVSPLRQEEPAYGGSNYNDNRREINSVFDGAAKSINEAHDGARFNARGTQATKLLRLAEARADALGEDFGIKTSARNTDVNDATARRGQDIAATSDRAKLENDRMKMQLDQQMSDARIKSENARLQSELGEKSYDRFDKLAGGLFTKAGEDGKMVEDSAMKARFLAEAAQNAPQLFQANGPGETGPMLMEAYKRFQESLAIEQATGIKSSVWDKNMQTRENVTIGDAIASKGVGVRDVLRDAVEGTPFVDPVALDYDSEGRMVARKGEDDLDRRRRRQGDNQ
jgi:hypothetical protein